MDQKDIPAARLASQRFWDKSFSKAQEVVSWFGAIQGQEYALTKWGIGLRAPKLKDEDVEKDLTDGRILRTHLLRPTWHFVSDKDIRWMLKLTAPTVHQASAFMYRSLELDKKLFLRSNKVFTSVLAGRAMTRNELTAELKRNRIVASGPRLAYIFMNAELDGLICSGPRLGKQSSYALLEERAAVVPEITRDEALFRLTRTYFTSRGPATLQDFATWSGLKVVDCKKGIESASPHIAEERIGGHPYYLSSNIPETGLRPAMYFLPIYDEMIMGYKDRSALFMKRGKLKQPPKLRYNGMILDAGQVIGTWRRVEATKAIETQFDFFAPLTGRQKSNFKAAFKHLEQFSQRQIEDSSP
jgi:hypothetical protein